MDTVQAPANINKLTNLQYWFMEYKKDHMTEGNIKTHYIGVPVVTLSLIGLLNEVTFKLAGTPLSASMILVAIGMLWYLLLDFKLASLIALPMFALYFGSLLISFKAHIALHIVGWVFQLLGHYKYEGRSPAFFKSLPQLLIGPIFIFAKTINYNWNKK